MLNTSFQFILDIDISSRELLCLNCGQIFGHIITHNHIEKLDMLNERGIILIGDADLHCLRCGSIREWHPNEDTLFRLVNRVQQQRKKSN